MWELLADWGSAIAWIIVGVIITIVAERITDRRDQKARRARIVATLSHCLRENVRQMDDQPEVTTLLLDAAPLIETASECRELLTPSENAALSTARLGITGIADGVRGIHASYAAGNPVQRRLAAASVLKKRIDEEVRPACVAALVALGQPIPDGPASAA